MSAKPIKHGIKVYALCCAYTGYLYMLEIWYTGKGGTPDGLPKGVSSGLLYEAGATGTTDRILYTDNVYTSLAVMMTHIYISFSILLVGTYALTKKKSRTMDNFPFAKPSNGTLKWLVKSLWTRIVKLLCTLSKPQCGRI
jgi:hypothetical protein